MRAVVFWGRLPDGSLSQKLVDEALDQESNISFITQIELLVWTPPNPDNLKIYQEFVAQSNVLHVNDAFIERTSCCLKSRLMNSLFVSAFMD